MYRNCTEVSADFLRTRAPVTPLQPRSEGPYRPLTCGYVRGPGRARPDDSRGVNAVLYQLSYRPKTNRTQSTAQTLRRRTRSAA